MAIDPKIKYREDDEDAGGPNGTAGAKRAAFPVPADGDMLVWRGLKDPGPRYRPYVIKAEYDAAGKPTFSGKTLKFSFLKASGTFGPTVHEIDLEDLHLVWAELPSTLHGLSAATPCAFLFLTAELEQRAPDLYRDGYGPDLYGYGPSGGASTLTDPGTGGTGKWPRAAGK